MEIRYCDSTEVERVLVPITEDLTGLNPVFYLTFIIIMGNSSFTQILLHGKLNMLSIKDKNIKDE